MSDRKDLKMIDCSEMIEKMGSFLDRELSSGEMKLVQFHLDQCGLCSGAFRWENRTLTIVKDYLSGQEPPPELTDKIFAMCREEE